MQLDSCRCARARNVQGAIRTHGSAHIDTRKPSVGDLCAAENAVPPSSTSICSGKVLALAFIARGRAHVRMEPPHE